MASQNAPANAKRLLKALIDRANSVPRLSTLRRRGGSRKPNSAIPGAGFRLRLAVKPPRNRSEAVKPPTKDDRVEIPIALPNVRFRKRRWGNRPAQMPGIEESSAN